MRRSTSKVIRVELVENNEQEFSYERPAVTNLKLTFLILMTFGIVVGMYALTYLPPHAATQSKSCREALSTPTLLQEESSSVSSLSTSSSSGSDGTVEPDSGRCSSGRPWRNKLRGRRLCRPCRIWSDCSIHFAFGKYKLIKQRRFLRGKEILISRLWVGFESFISRENECRLSIWLIYTWNAIIDEPFPIPIHRPNYAIISKLDIVHQNIKRITLGLS